jgi:hypothetical protein
MSRAAVTAIGITIKAVAMLEMSWPKMAPRLTAAERVPQHEV